MSRNEELTALAEWKKVVVGMPSGAGTLLYKWQASLVQSTESGLRTSLDLAKLEVVQLPENLRSSSTLRFLLNEVGAGQGHDC